MYSAHGVASAYMKRNSSTLQTCGSFKSMLSRRKDDTAPAFLNLRTPRPPKTETFSPLCSIAPPIYASLLSAPDRFSLPQLFISIVPPPRFSRPHPPSAFPPPPRVFLSSPHSPPSPHILLYLPLSLLLSPLPLVSLTPLCSLSPVFRLASPSRFSLLSPHSPPPPHHFLSHRFPPTSFLSPSLVPLPPVPHLPPLPI